MKFLVLSVFCAFSASSVYALSSEETAEVTETCWNHAEVSVVTAASLTECSGMSPPEDIAPEQLDTCKAAIESCCQQYFKDKDDCAAGMKLAAEKRCNTPSTDIGKTCCEECSIGKWTGESQGAGGCGSAAGEGVSTSSALRKNAFHQCCLEAVEKPTTTPKPVETTTEKKKPKKICKTSGCQHNCDDEGGVVRCSCKEGFRLQGDKKSCADINECAEAIDDLCTVEDTVCHNIPGAFKCVPIKKRDVGLSCPPGFKRNVINQVCDDINECQLPRPPCAKYLCENTIGGYKCAGKPGKPFEEAIPGAPQHVTEAATTSVPKTDICPPGFRAGPDDECIDIDECTENLDDCQRLSQHCINTHGSFFCQDHVSKRCSPGFKVNAATGICEDIDECEESSEVCKKSEVCINLPGAYNCKSKISQLPKLATRTCQEGTRLRPGAQVCEDIDECREGTHLCDQFQICINTFGAHECRCKNGFELDLASASCVDIDECALKLDNCGPGLYCQNSLGSFACTHRPPSTSTTTTPAPLYEYEYYDSNETIPDEKYPDVVSPTTVTTPRSTPSPTTPRPTRPAPRITPRPAHRSTTRPPSTSIPSTTSTTLKPTTITARTPRPYPSYPERPSSYPSYPTRPTNIPTYPTYPDRRYYTTSSTTTQRPSTPGTTPKPEPSTTEPERQPYTTPEAYTEDSRPSYTNPEDRSPSYTPSEGRSPPYIPSNAVSEDRRPYYPSYDPYGRPSTPVNRTRPGYPRRPIYPTQRPTSRPPELPRRQDTTIQPSTTEKNIVANDLFNPDDVHCLYGYEKDAAGNCIDKTTTALDKPLIPKELRCLNGYESDINGNCVDIDECKSSRHVCGSMEQCVNNIGSYKCECLSGYRRGDDGWCVPARTSTTTTTTTTTVKPPESNAVSSDWAYNPYRPHISYGSDRYPPIICELGYRFDSTQQRCIDINECTLNKDTCSGEEDCVNIDGGFRCVCGTRCRAENEKPRYVFVLDPCGRRAGLPHPQHSRLGEPCCVPSVQPSPRQPSEPGSNVITVGAQYGQRRTWSPRPTYSRHPHNGAVLTTCPWGYKLTGDKRCYDIDECATNSSACGPQQRCENFYGGYSCQCATGHRLIGQNECADIDECTHSTPCSYNARCINTVGSYRCECTEGFRNAPTNDKVCVDVDECTEMPQVCHQRCANAWGSYRCYCKRGYRLGNDSRTCVDVNECEEWKTVRLRGKLCGGECVNEPGSYRCACPAGYRLSNDMTSCIDIDECETGEATCSHTSDPGYVCQNTRGSYHCHHIDCPAGYRLESKHRCTRIQQSCLVSDWSCLQQPSTYSYNFITFVANIFLPSGSVDLFTMHGPSWVDSVVSFEMRMVHVQASPGVTSADLRCFDMRPSGNMCVISLLCSLEGPQVAELELTMSLYQHSQFAGSAVARLIIIVSQYDF